MVTDDCKFYVYMMFRRWNGIPFYVGKGHGRRAYLLRGRNPHFNNIVAKCAGDVPIIIIQRGMTEREAFDMERDLIRIIGRGENGPLVNLTDGGEGASGFKQSPKIVAKRVASYGSRKGMGKGRKHSEEAREKLRVIHQNRTPETRERLSMALKGRKLSPEHCEKLGDAKRGKKQRADTIQKRAKANTGKTRSDETRARMSAAQKERFSKDGATEFLKYPRSAETRAKMSAAMTGNQNGKRHRQPGG
jgi:hypothetical protein